MKIELNEEDLLIVKNQAEWRNWLKQNYHTAKEAWLVYFKTHSGIQGIDYESSVDEALCFGWIDSTIRRIDQDRYARRFSPRKPGSSYSLSNRKRLRELINQGLVADDIMSSLTDLTLPE